MKRPNTVDEAQKLLTTLRFRHRVLPARSSWRWEMRAHIAKAEQWLVELEAESAALAAE